MLIDNEFKTMPRFNWLRSLQLEFAENPQPFYSDLADQLISVAYHLANEPKKMRKITAFDRETVVKNLSVGSFPWSALFAKIHQDISDGQHIFAALQTKTYDRLTWAMDSFLEFIR